MIAHTAELDEVILSGNFRSSYRGTLFRGDDVVLGPNEFEFAGPPTVTVDENALSVRTLNASIVDPTGNLLPKDSSDLLAPYGNELLFEMGVWIPSRGDYEWIPNGRYRLRRNDASSTRIISVTGLERSIVVAAARNEAPYVISGGFLADQINAYLQTKYPGIPFTADPGAYTTGLVGAPRIYQEGTTDGDPWVNMKSLAIQFGRDVVVDSVGGAQLQPVVDPTDAVVTWDYVTGETNMAFDGSLGNDTETVHNVWVVSGEAQGGTPPVRAVVEVTDTDSPIYAGPGTRFGRVPQFFVSSFLTTSDQCQAMGEALRLAETGRRQNVPFTALAHPCHEAGDIVHYQSDALGVDAILILSGWTVPGDLRSRASFKTRLVSLT